MHAGSWSVIVLRKNFAQTIITNRSCIVASMDVPVVVLGAGDGGVEELQLWTLVCHQSASAGRL